MPRKLKFKPAVTKIALNHEQAVLACDCHQGKKVYRGAWNSSGGQFVSNESALFVCDIGKYTWRIANLGFGGDLHSRDNSTIS